jgi:hypothetical protein
MNDLFVALLPRHQHVQVMRQHGIRSTTDAPRYLPPELDQRQLAIVGVVHCARHIKRLRTCRWTSSSSTGDGGDCPSEVVTTLTYVAQTATDLLFARNSAFESMARRWVAESTTASLRHPAVGRFESRSAVLFDQAEGSQRS